MTNLPMDKKSVDLRQETFLDFYLTNGFNAAEAAISAGYSKKDARKVAYNILNSKTVMEKMQNRYNKSSRKLKVSHNDITNELMAIAFSGAADAFNDWTDLKKFNELTEQQKKAISEIDTRTVIDKDGNKNEYVKIKFHDKNAALKELGRHTGYYEIDNSQKTQSVTIQLSDDKLVDKLKEE
jgi:phage terminase small subunit